MRVSKEAAERLRDCAYWVAGATVSSLAEQAIMLLLQELEAERGPIAKREGPVPTGRPLKPRTDTEAA